MGCCCSKDNDPLIVAGSTFVVGDSFLTNSSVIIEIDVKNRSIQVVKGVRGNIRNSLLRNDGHEDEMREESIVF